MAKTDFRTSIDGNGRVRFFVDGSANTLDEYVAKYVKTHGKLPDVPVGLGGSAAPVVTPNLEERVAQLQARVDELEAERQAQAPNEAADEMEEPRG